MPAEPIINPIEVLSGQHERAEPDLLRALLKTFVEALMGAEADAACGTAYGARTPERTSSRNGYRARAWDTGLSTIELHPTDSACRSAPPRTAAAGWPPSGT
jgi:hypothetical protein